MTVNKWKLVRYVIISGSFLFILLVAYVGSYSILYHRGVSEATEYRSDYFFYVPITDIIAAQTTTQRHHFLAMLFGPINRLHHSWLGGRSACACVLFSLGGKEREE